MNEEPQFIGSRVRIVAHDDLQGRIGIVRAVSDRNGRIRVSSEPDPCSPGANLNEPHWSAWVGAEQIVLEAEGGAA